MDNTHTEILPLVPRVGARPFFKPHTAMPALSHFPDRGVLPFTDARSEVLAWIREIYSCDLFVARRIFDIASRQQVRAIKFDSETKLWRGNPDWHPDFRHTGTKANILARRRQRTPEQQHAREAWRQVRERVVDPVTKRKRQVRAQRRRERALERRRRKHYTPLEMSRIRKRIRDGIAAGVRTAELQRQICRTFGMSHSRFYQIRKQAKQTGAQRRCQCDNGWLDNGKPCPVCSVAASNCLRFQQAHGT